jgi:hypothetical protein
MYKKLITITITGILAAQLAGCVTYMGMTASSTPLEGKKIEKNLGPSEGFSDYGYSLLGLWTLTQPDMDIAINDAVATEEGDALINIRWYEVSYYALIFSMNRIVVKGDVIKFAPAEAEKQAGKPAKNR